MNAFVSSGNVVDLIIVVMLLEALALSLRRTLGGRGLAVAELLAGLAPGLLLLLAVRAALTGAPSGLIAAYLSGAGLLHVVDLIYRQRGSKNG